MQVVTSVATAVTAAVNASNATMNATAASEMACGEMSVVDAAGCALVAGAVWREPDRQWQLQPDSLTAPLRNRRCGVYRCEQDEGYECYLGNVRSSQNTQLAN